MEGKIIFAICVVFLMTKNANACSCERGHLQKSLCRNGSYAALVKVRKIEYVYIVERPKYKFPKSSGIPIINRRNEAKNFPENTKGNELDHDLKPETEEVEVVVKDLDQLTQKHYYSSYIRYRVKVYETYKGLKQEEVEGKKVYIYTSPHGSTCGANLQNKEMYLLIGSVYDNRLRIGLCNHKFLWNSLDSKQRKVVRQNMRMAKATCESNCDVHFCWGGCPKPAKDSCLWTSHMDGLNSKFNIHPANYICTRDLGKQDSPCTWNDPFSTMKRGKRRRRHHHEPEGAADDSHQ